MHTIMSLAFQASRPNVIVSRVTCMCFFRWPACHCASPQSVLCTQGQLQKTPQNSDDCANKGGKKIDALHKTKASSIKVQKETSLRVGGKGNSFHSVGHLVA